MGLPIGRKRSHAAGPNSGPSASRAKEAARGPKARDIPCPPAQVRKLILEVPRSRSMLKHGRRRPGAEGDPAARAPNFAGTPTLKVASR